MSSLTNNTSINKNDLKYTSRKSNKRLRNIYLSFSAIALLVIAGAFTYFNINQNSDTASADELANSDILVISNNSPNPSQTCSDNGKALESNCFTSLTTALERVQNGQSIFLLSGTYTGPFDITKSVTISGPTENGSEAIITTAPNTNDVAFAILVDDVTVQNLTFADMTNNQAIAGGSNFATGTSVNGVSSNVNIRNNTFRNINTPGEGGGVIQTITNGSIQPNRLLNWNITNNEFIQDSAFNGDAAISLQSIGDTQISNNTIRNFDKGIEVFNATNSVIFENSISQMNSFGILFGDVIGPIEGLTISNNRISNVATTRSDRGGIVILGGQNINGTIEISENQLETTTNGITLINGNITNKNINLIGNAISDQSGAGIRFQGQGSFSLIEKNTFSNNAFDIDFSSDTNQTALGRNWDSINGNNFGVTDQSSISEIEALINHACKENCNDTDYTLSPFPITGGEVIFYLDKPIGITQDTLFIQPSSVNWNPDPEVDGLSIFAVDDHTYQILDSRLVENGQTSVCSIRIKELTSEDDEANSGFATITPKLTSSIAGATFNTQTGYLEMNYDPSNGCNFTFPASEQKFQDYFIEFRALRSDTQKFGRDDALNMLFGAFSRVTVSGEALP